MPTPNQDSARRRALIVSCALLAASAAAPLPAVITISEIHYHPEGDDGSLEFIELCNESPDPMDISDYFFSAGIATGSIGVKALAAAVIGGFGNVPGAVLGGLLLGVFDSVVAADISATWRDAIVYGLIIVVLLIRAGLPLQRRVFARG